MRNRVFTFIEKRAGGLVVFSWLESVLMLLSFFCGWKFIYPLVGIAFRAIAAATFLLMRKCDNGRIDHLELRLRVLMGFKSSSLVSRDTRGVPYRPS